MLPGGSGLDVLRGDPRRSARSTGRACIVVSAWSDETNRSAAGSAGADEFLGKPFAPDHLAARGGGAAGRSRAWSAASSSPRTLVGRIVGGSLLAAALAAGALALLLVSLLGLRSSIDHEAHSKDTVAAALVLQSKVSDYESALRSYLLTSNGRFLTSLEDGARRDRARARAARVARRRRSRGAGARRHRVVGRAVVHPGLRGPAGRRSRGSSPGAAARLRRRHGGEAPLGRDPPLVRLA